MGLLVFCSMYSAVAAMQTCSTVYSLRNPVSPVVGNGHRLAAVQVSFTENDGPAAEESSGEQAASGGLAEGEEILQEAIAEEEAGKA